MTEPDDQIIAAPQWKLPKSSWWITAIGTLIAVVLWIKPDWVELPQTNRLWICSAFVLAPVTLLAILHGLRRVRFFCLRACAYCQLVAQLAQVTSERDQARSLLTTLIQERQERNSLRIAYCYMFNDRPMIALKRKRGFRVNLGDIFTVATEDDGRVLGTFEASEDSGDYYIACSLGPMDALWLGHMKQGGSTRSEPPPHAIAMRLQGEGDGNAREHV